MKTSILIVIITAGITAGCEPQTADGRTPAQGATEAPGDSAVLEGTPPGDLAEWVRDMRSGLDSVQGKLSGPRPAVHVGVLTLYATRQEFLEMYYGAGGRMGPSPALAEAVMTAEARFHDLMRLTSATPASDESAIRAAMEAVDRQLAGVLALKDQTERKVRAEGK